MKTTPCAALLCAILGLSAMSAQAGPTLQGRVLPEPGAAGVQVDSPLRLRLDAPSALGGSALPAVRIYRTSDNTLVDVIHAGGEVNAIGTARDGYQRVVRYQAIEADGAGVIIRPHDGRLDYGTEYRVEMDDGLLAGATVDGRPFSGIGSAAGWTFRTRPAAPTGATLTVDGDGPADFRTVQGALNHAMRHLARQEPVTISIANGRYGDLLYLRGKDNVTLRGASRDGAVIAVENGNAVNPGAGGGQPPGKDGVNGGRSVFLVEDADNLRIADLSVVNTTWRGKPNGGQAEALNFASDGRLIVTNSSFISEQDTILVRGWSWFYRSLIAGNVDFIWGYSRAALFEDSEIRSLGDSAGPKKGGYIVQARVPAREDAGFVFLNSRITHGPGPAGNDVPAGSSFLARPGSSWDKVSYVNCRIAGHIAARGWQGQPREGSGWYEYNSMDLDGKPLDLSARSGGAQLRPEQAARLMSRDRVFAAYGNGEGWNPQAD